MIARLGASRIKDQEVRTVYLDMAARWRPTAQQEAIDDVLGTYDRQNGIKPDALVVVE